MSAARLYHRAMSTPSPDQTPKPVGPFTLTPSRIVLLILGALVLFYTVSIFLGGPANYQMLKEGAAEQKAAAPTTQQ